MQPFSRNTQTAYGWGEGGVGWPLVDTDEILVFGETLAPALSEKRHQHKKAAQCFYILEGSTVINIDGHDRILAQGMALQIQPRACHAIANDSSNEIRFLVISSLSTRSGRHGIMVKK